MSLTDKQETNLYLGINKFLEQYPELSEWQKVHLKTSLFIICLVRLGLRSNEGSFITSVANNNWEKSLSNADSTNRKLIYVYYEFIVNFNIHYEIKDKETEKTE